MTFFVTRSFLDLSSIPPASEVADKNRPGTLLNYLTHSFAFNFDPRNLEGCVRCCVSAFKHSMTTEKQRLKFDYQNMTTETEEFANFGGQMKRLRTALNPFKYALYSAFKQLQNGFKTCQTVL